MRITFRSVAFGAIVAANVFAVLAIGFLPGAIADSSPSPDMGASDDQAMAGVTAMGVFAALRTPEPTPSPTATPTATPSPSPFPTPSPTHTKKPTPRPKPKATPLPDTVAGARQYVKNAVGITQYNCIDYVWTRESKWNPLAGTPTGAYGIPQAFPGTKMAAFGSNWRTSPITQVKWGLSYVKGRYGSACGAYDFWKAHGWY